jgi:hypothetical protein
MEPTEAFDDSVQFVFIYKFVRLEISGGWGLFRRARAWVKGQQAFLGPSLQSLTGDTPPDRCLI